ncbi:hypothetical protein ACVWZ6_008123 [Bradyrhizobium sp. GM6.1]
MSNTGWKEDLARDIESYVLGEVPSPFELHRAPVIQEWSTEVRRVAKEFKLVVTGQAKRHPGYADGDLICTPRCSGSIARPGSSGPRSASTSWASRPATRSRSTEWTYDRLSDRVRCHCAACRRRRRAVGTTVAAAPGWRRAEWYAGSAKSPGGDFRRGNLVQHVKSRRMATSPAQSRVSSPAQREPDAMTPEMERLLERLQTGWQPHADEIDMRIRQRRLFDWSFAPSFSRPEAVLIGRPENVIRTEVALWINENLEWALCEDGFWWLSSTNWPTSTRRPATDSCEADACRSARDFRMIETGCPSCQNHKDSPPAEKAELAQKKRTPDARPARAEAQGLERIVKSRQRPQ